MSPTHHGTQALDRCLSLWRAVAEDGGRTSLAGIAAILGLSVPTAHRMTAQLVRHGLLVRCGRGRYTTGLVVHTVAGERSAVDVVVAAARPLLRRVARATGRTAHLGAFDGDMVTYLVREAPPGGHVFTREGVQLEAYCSAVGKMLLAMRPVAEREAYLAAGGFVPLTARTLCDGDALREHLRVVAADGFATDDEEVADGLFCLAVGLDLPVPGLALSLAGPVPPPADRAALLATVRATAAQIAVLFQPADVRRT